MKNYLLAKVSILAFLFVTLVANAAPTAGVFQPPVNLSQLWSQCQSLGYISPPTQYYMQLNSDLSPAKYHMGEDLNGVCGGNTDIGGDLRALADGKIELVNTNPADAKGRYVVTSYTLPDGRLIYVWYMHCDSVLVAQGSIVTPGQKIATLGNSGNAPSAHLHWEIHKDVISTINSYQLPLAVTTAVKLTAPSLVVDDRSGGGFSQPLTTGGNTQFTVGKITPAALLYVQDQLGVKYSIKRAADAGIIAWYGITWLGTDGVWYYNPDLMKVVLFPGTQYRIYAQAPSLGLNVMYAGDNFRADRARMDIVRAASQDVRFKNVLTETYGENLSWDPNWELRWMGLTFLNNNGVTWTVYIQQTTYKSNPFVRWTNFWDPNTGQWTAWKEAGVDVLY